MITVVTNYVFFLLACLKDRFPFSPLPVNISSKCDRSNKGIASLSYDSYKQLKLKLFLIHSNMFHISKTAVMMTNQLQCDLTQTLSDITSTMDAKQSGKLCRPT